MVKLRPNVCMIVHNASAQLLLGQRAGEPEVWQFPQGGVDPGDSEEDSVIRELCEELGAPAESFRIRQRLTASHEYLFEAPREYQAGIFAGQRQSFWLVSFMGQDRELTLLAAGHEPEFSAIRWCTLEETLKLADPKRVPGYRAPLAEVAAILGAGRY